MVECLAQAPTVGGRTVRLSDIWHRIHLAPHRAHTLLVTSLLSLSQSPAPACLPASEDLQPGPKVDLPGLHS